LCFVSNNKCNKNKCSVVMKLDFFGKECQHELTLLKLENKPNDSKLPKIELHYTFVAMLQETCSLIIHRSQNLRAMKHIDKKSLPVRWRANKKAWMTGSLFEDWFFNCFQGSPVIRQRTGTSEKFESPECESNFPAIQHRSSNPSIKASFRHPKHTKSEELSSQFLKN
jgi:hypothetical protein